MSTGFERIGRDPGLQDHWIRRLVAFIIDSVIVGIGVLAITAVITIPLILIAAVGGIPWFVFNPFTFPFFTGILSVFYFALLESIYGWTLGKRIMNLKTISSGGGKPSLNASLLRNISKIYWILVLLDVIIALATPGHPHQKLSDRFAATNVLSANTQPPPS